MVAHRSQDSRLTEQRNPSSARIDRLSTLEIIDLISAEDALIAEAVREQRERIARAVDLILESFRHGGRLFYVGAGTSGRLGVLEAAEMPPTFGTDPTMVQGIMAGGVDALARAQEGAEDRPDLAVQDVDARNVSAHDFVLGIATSGTTPYVHAALARARERGARTGFLLCTQPGEALVRTHDVVIAPLVGPEVVTGSTRMKAGTATKMVLNMITTAAMVRLGKVYGNLMVDLQITARKLYERAQRILVQVLDLEPAEAEQLLQRAGGHLKTAIVMHRLGLDATSARSRLDEAGGVLSRIIGDPVG